MYGYKERKAAQTAAFFALQAGGSINILKLAKLLYLAERESMSKYDEPLFYDRLVSMDHGPVTSISLNHLNGLSESIHWPKFVTDGGSYNIDAVKGIDFANLDELSRADLSILKELWEKFADFTGFQLRDWTHFNCPEWENPNGSSKRISHSQIYKFLNKPKANERAQEIIAYRRLHSTLDAC